MQETVPLSVYSPADASLDDLLRQWITTRCRESRLVTPFQPLYHDWRNWIVAQQVSSEVRATIGTRWWFEDAIAYAKYPLTTPQGLTCVRGITLDSFQAPFPDSLIDWPNLRAYAVDHPTLPVRWSLTTLRFRPPIALLWKWFIDVAQDPDAPRQRLPGSRPHVNRKGEEYDPYKEVHFVRLDYAYAGWKGWLREQGASESFLSSSFHGRSPFECAVEAHGYQLTTYEQRPRWIVGLSLLECYRQPINYVRRPLKPLPDGTPRPTKPLRVRNLERSYEERKEYEAKIAAGLIVPGQPTEAARYADEYTYPDTLSPVGRGEPESTPTLRQEQVRQPARAYLDYAICPTPEAPDHRVLWLDLERGFLAYLTNRHLEQVGAKRALRIVLAERDLVLAGQRKLFLKGYRFRTPDNV